MNLREAREVIDTLAADPDASRVFGQAYETADGTTVIPVAKLRGAPRRGSTTREFGWAPNRSGSSWSRTARRHLSLRSTQAASR